MQAETTAATFIVERTQDQRLITGEPPDQFHATDAPRPGITLENVQKRWTIGAIT